MKFVFLFLLFLSPSAFANEIQIRFTEPICKQYPEKTLGAYCTREDLPASIKDENGPSQTLLREISHPENQSITLATMTFSNRTVAKALCAALDKGVQVQVILDASAEPATAQTVVECGGNLKLVGTKEEEGQMGDLHHNKFLLIQRAGPTDTLIFSTANFSNPGLSINHETWGFVSSADSNPLNRNHKCLVNALLNSSSNRKEFRLALEKCKVDDSKEQIQSLFLPTQSKELVKKIEKAIANSERVWMTSNRFSFIPIVKAFDLRRDKSNSRAIFDDDLYWAAKLPNSEEYSGNALDAERIAELKQTGVDVRYTETSYEAAQKMHNKFLVLDKMVIVGAGNFTAGGLTRNFENFYVITDASTVEQFASKFKQLWSLSREPRHLSLK